MRLLDVTPASQNIMLVGRHGLGKSQILKRYFEEKGARVVALFLGQMADPGDLIGLPQGGERTSFAPPYWWPNDGQPIVLFLDELNRARPELLQTVMDLVLNRSLAGRQLPEGSRIISAVNEGDEYQLTLLDPALVSRFNVYHFAPTVDEWLQWAESEGLDARVTSFIAAHGTWLDGGEAPQAGIDTGLEKQPDRRAWQRLSDVVAPMKEISDDDLDILSGIVGAAAASQFYASVTGRRLVSGAEVLHNFPAHEAELRKYVIHQLAAVNESIFRHLQLEPDAAFAPNLEAYYAMLEAGKENEAIAHFCNLFEGGTYDQAVLFIMNHAPKLYARMALFIANL